MKELMIIAAGRQTGKSQFAERLMARREYTPKQYLREMLTWDRAPEHDETWMTSRLQQRWPGAYRIEKVTIVDEDFDYVTYRFRFDTPEDETWFNLQYA